MSFLPTLFERAWPKIGWSRLVLTAAMCLTLVLCTREHRRAEHALGREQRALESAVAANERAEYAAAAERGVQAREVAVRAPGSLDALVLGIAAVEPRLRRSLSVPPAASVGLAEAVGVAGYPLLPPFRLSGTGVTLAFSPDGSRLLSIENARGSLSGRNTGRLWDVRTGMALGKLADKHPTYLRAIEFSSAMFSPDGKQLLAPGGLLWDAGTGKLERDDGSATGHAVLWVGSEFWQLDQETSTSATVRILGATRFEREIELRGQSGELTAAAASADGKRLATAGNSSTEPELDGDGRRVPPQVSNWVHIWNLPSGQRLMRLELGSARPEVMQFSPDGERFLLGTSSNDVSLIHFTPTYGPLTLPLSARSDSLSFSSDGKRILLITNDHRLDILDAETRALVVSRYTEGTDKTWERTIESARFSPDGSRVLLADRGGQVSILDATTARTLSRLRGPWQSIHTAQFSPDGSLVAVMGHQEAVQLLRWQTFQRSTVLWESGDLSVELKATADGSLWLLTRSQNVARLWNARTGKLLHTLLGHQKEIFDGSISRDGTQIVTVSRDGEIRLWSAHTGQLLRVLASAQQERYDADTSGRKVAFSADGTRVLVGTLDQPAARLFDTKTGECLATLPGDKFSLRELALSPDGEYAATSCHYEPPRLWEVRSGKLLATLRESTGKLQVLRFSADGRRLLTAGEDGLARIWDAHTGQAGATLSGHLSMILDANFSPDGNLVVTASTDCTTRLWDSASGHLRTRWEVTDGSAYTAEFSPDGKKVVGTLAEGVVALWDVASEQLADIIHVPTKGLQRSPLFTPDGTQLLGRDSQGRVHLIDLDLRPSLRYACMVLQTHPTQLQRVAQECQPYLTAPK